MVSLVREENWMYAKEILEVETAGHYFIYFIQTGSLALTRGLKGRHFHSLPGNEEHPCAPVLTSGAIEKTSGNVSSLDKRQNLLREQLLLYPWVLHLSTG